MSTRTQHHQEAAGAAGSREVDTRCADGRRATLLPHFLLVGSERSGSTMLRLMLDHHPQLSCMYECDFLTRHYADCRGRPAAELLGRINSDWHYKHCGIPIPADTTCYEDAIQSFFRERAQSTGKQIIGATFHHNFAGLPELFPDAKYIHLLRDGRPVASSIVQMGWAGNLYCGALQWRDAIRQVRAIQRRVPPERWLQVRYEDLLKDSGATLAAICDHLGIPYSSEMLSYDRDTTYSRPDPANVDRWRRLPARQLRLAELAAGPELEELGYSRLFSSATAGPARRALLVLHNRWGRARFRCRRFGFYLLAARKFWSILGVKRAALERRYEAIQEAHIK